MTSEAIRQEWLQRQRQRYRRGLITEPEFARAVLKVEDQTGRPSRPAELEPPIGAKSVSVKMDRTTELALEYLMSLKPTKIDLDRPVEKAEMFRIAVCRWAIEAGWDLPEELL